MILNFSQEYLCERNIITPLKLEIPNYDFAVKYFIYYATGILLHRFVFKLKKIVLHSGVEMNYWN